MTKMTSFLHRLLRTCDIRQNDNQCMYYINISYRAFADIFFFDLRSAKLHPYLTNDRKTSREKKTLRKTSKIVFWRKEGGLYYMGGTYIFFLHPNWSKLCTAPLIGPKNRPTKKKLKKNIFDLLFGPFKKVNFCSFYAFSGGT